jgi:hypothetical protein
MDKIMYTQVKVNRNHEQKKQHVYQYVREISNTQPYRVSPKILTLNKTP